MNNPFQLHTVDQTFELGLFSPIIFQFLKVNHSREEMLKMPIIFKQHCAHCNMIVLQWVNNYEHFTEIEYVVWKDDIDDSNLMDQEILCYPCWSKI